MCLEESHAQENARSDLRELRLVEDNSMPRPSPFLGQLLVGFRPSSPSILSRSALTLSLAINLIFVLVNQEFRLSIEELVSPKPVEYLKI
ncbi:hypothetical protein TNCV_2648891 [Trichonephila clavipes]|nr:hypothetical protein TNCV_2648891 [Trichonephila clavipes]